MCVCVCWRCGHARELTTIGDTVKVMATKEGVHFRVEGDVGTGSILCKHGLIDDEEENGSEVLRLLAPPPPPPAIARVGVCVCVCL